MNQQEQLLDIDRKLQLLLEQVAVMNRRRFDRSSEKLIVDDQIAFMEGWMMEEELTAGFREDG